MKSQTTLSRRAFLKQLGLAGLTAPFFTRNLISAAPSTILRHASFGGSGMAWADIQAICCNDFVKFTAVADVDLNKLGPLKAKFPDAKIYQDWRELLDKEQNNIDSVNVGTPDHMHGPIAMAALQLGKHVYCQKPLTHDIYETRQLTVVAREKKLVTQMGIQCHSEKCYRMAVALVQAGAVGKIKEVYTWSNKKWGAVGAPPEKNDPVPAGLDWNLWLGVSPERPYVQSHYHPGNWRKRLDFGTGTFGDMGCHIYDPVFEALALTAPISVRSEGPAPDQWNWSINANIKYIFPGTQYTEGNTVAVTWYDGDERPPADIQALVIPPQTEAAKADPKKKPAGIPDQGSILIGTKGVMLIPHIAMPKLFPVADFKEFKMPEIKGSHHWTQWAEACIGKGQASANFDYAGPLTESVLLGSVAVRYPKTTLEWDAAAMNFKNQADAAQYVRRTYRKGWEVKGL